MNTRHKLFLTAVLGFAVTHAALADSTAFDLIKKGDDYIGVQSKDKVVQIHSDKSVASLTPNIWHVAYYDPDAAFKFVEVKFGAGEKMDVSHPARPFQAPASESQILDRSKLKVDSDQALKIATAQPLLKNLTLKASKLTLDHGDVGPVWKVQLWAAKLKNPNKDADIGAVILSATDGSVIKTDLHPDKVD
jgi:hypothetical protein